MICSVKNGAANETKALVRPGTKAISTKLKKHTPKAVYVHLYTTKEYTIQYVQRDKDIWREACCQNNVHFKPCSLPKGQSMCGCSGLGPEPRLLSPAAHCTFLLGCNKVTQPLPRAPHHCEKGTVDSDHQYSKL